MAGVRKAVDLFGKAMRETGHAMDRLTLTAAENEIFRDTFARHRQMMPLKEKAPTVADSAFVAPNAAIVGSVKLMDSSNVWYRSVMRADKHAIKVGPFSNIQDQAVVQCVGDASPQFPPNTVIGSYVTVGHGARLTSCLVGDQCLIGQGSIVSEGCVVNTGAIVAAGAVLPPNTTVPAMQLWAGNPAKFIRNVTDDELAASISGALEYCKLAQEQGADFKAFDVKYNN